MVTSSTLFIFRKTCQNVSQCCILRRVAAELLYLAKEEEWKSHWDDTWDRDTSSTSLSIKSSSTSNTNTLCALRRIGRESLKWHLTGERYYHVLPTTSLISPHALHYGGWLTHKKALLKPDILSINACIVINVSYQGEPLMYAGLSCPGHASCKLSALKWPVLQAVCTLS